MNLVDKVVLGTVQFGLNYGINNPYGQVLEAEVEKIMKLAYERGIRTLDTSAAYGNSEQVLGKALGARYKDFHIVSKYPQSEQRVETVFFSSLDSLQQKELYGYLVHHFDFYLSHPFIWDEIRSLKEKGKIRKIGFSLYTISQLQHLLDCNVKFDILQFPYNVFDRQFEPYLPLLKERGVEIHVRSTFLQGLFFMDRERLPEKLRPLKTYLTKLDDYAKATDRTVAEVALNFNLQNPFIDGVLIGVDTTEQLQDNLQNISDRKVELSIDVKEKELLNPVNWK